MVWGVKVSLTILLALAVFLANAYCACAGATSVNADVNVVATAADQAPHCHAAAPKDPPSGCHDNAPGSGGRDDSHDCAHCTGTLSADAPAAKTTLPAPAVQPFILGVAVSHAFVTTGAHQLGLFNCSDLPPPRDPPTLLNLACALNN